MGIPILLDTDIGTDIDDVYALILAATSPELDLLGVTVVNHNVYLRAKLARLMLDHLGCHSIPVGVGFNRALDSKPHPGWGGYEGCGVELNESELGDPAQYPTAGEVIDRAVQSCLERGERLTVITIGAMSNAAAFLSYQPDRAKFLAGITAMASSFRGIGGDSAEKEHNIACDALAAKWVFESGVPLRVVGLNVTQLTAWAVNDLEAICRSESRLARDLYGLHRVWFERIGSDRSPMHDGLAVATVFQPDLVTWEPVIPIVFMDDERRGMIEYRAGDKGATCYIATAVDAVKFHLLLRERIEKAVRSTERIPLS